MDHPMNYKELVARVAPAVNELFPWDVQELEAGGSEFLYLDVRCPSEFQVMHVDHSLNVPRGILEVAADYGYEETEPELVEARGRKVLIICRSGNRSILAAHTLQLMGFQAVYSLKTGLRGWNDYELPLVHANGNRVDQEVADRYFIPEVSEEQMGKRGTAR